MESPQASAFLLIYGIIAVASIIVFLDWLGRRKERHSKRPRT
jgi:hypothetical protein